MSGEIRAPVRSRSLKRPGGGAGSPAGAEGVDSDRAGSAVHGGGGHARRPLLHLSAHPTIPFHVALPLDRECTAR